MSLLATATTWINNDEPKKRVSSIRKQKKAKEFLASDIEHLSNPGRLENEKYTNIEEMKNINEDRNTKVTDLLSKMSESNDEDENEKFGNFEPIHPPELNIRKDFEKVKESKEYVAPNYSYSEGSNALRNNSLSKEPYGADNSKVEQYSNYSQSYNPSKKVVEPYYSKMGITGSSDDKLLEKMNYLIHMMEEQQTEKTSNITEEFILYTFLGVFVIFVIDSFNKTQRYIR